VVVVSVLGGMLGILMMIPLRRAFIVRQHGTLPYPEGTACADVLIVGEQGGASAKTVFIGFGMAAVYQFLWQGLKLWKEVPSRSLSWFKGAVPAIEVNPALLGVGYIIGTKISCVMVAGGVLSAFVLIPGVRLFGDGLAGPLYPGKVPIAEMSEEEIWKDYVLYIGAGAVAAGGIISLFRALPLIFSSIRSAVGEMRAQGEEKAGETRRTDRDLPLWLVGVGTVLVVLAVWGTTPLHGIFPWIPQLRMNLWAGRPVRILVRHRFIAAHRRNRIVVESDFRNDCRDVAVDLYDLSLGRHVAAAGSADSVVGRRGRVYRCIQWRHDFARLENRVPGRRDPDVAADGDLDRLDFIGPRDRDHPDRAQSSWDGVLEQGLAHAGCADRHVGANGDRDRSR
jgi:hypothetical protein